MSDGTQHAAGVHVMRKNDDGDNTFIMLMYHHTVAHKGVSAAVVVCNKVMTDRLID